jgi:hypothetical protein
LGSNITTQAPAVQAEATDNRVFVADTTAGLSVYDITNRNQPRFISSLPTSESCTDVVLQGNLAYLATGKTLVIANVADPANIQVLSNFITQDTIGSIQVVGNKAYLADGGKGLRIVDVSNPAVPTEIGSFVTTKAVKVVVAGNRAYVADSTGGLRILNVRDPGSTRQLNGPVGNHLVGVHVRLRAAARLPDPQRELLVELSGDHLVRRLHDQLRPPGVQFPQVAVHQRRRFLQYPQGTD